MKLYIVPTNKVSIKERETMDIKKIRYHNARYLLKNEAMGVNDFADKIGRSQSQTSAYIGENPTKNIGDKIARIIEQAFNKPIGWLDTQSKESESVETIHDLDIASKITQPVLPGLLDKNEIDSINACADKIRDIRNQIKILEREKTNQYNNMSNNVIDYCINEFTSNDYKIRHIHDNHSLSSVYLNKEYEQSDYDLIIEDKKGNLIGFYFWMVVLKQYRTPLPTFNIDVKNPEIEARVGLFVNHGEGMNFFFIPISELIIKDSPILVINYNRDIVKDNHGNEHISFEICDFKINDKSIIPYKDSFSIQVDQVTSEHQMRQLKEYLEAKIKHLDEKLTKK